MDKSRYVLTSVQYKEFLLILNAVLFRYRNQAAFLSILDFQSGIVLKLSFL